MKSRETVDTVGTFSRGEEAECVLVIADRLIPRSRFRCMQNIQSGKRNLNDGNLSIVLAAELVSVR